MLRAATGILRQSSLRSPLSQHHFFYKVHHFSNGTFLVNNHRRLNIDSIETAVITKVSEYSRGNDVERVGWITQSIMKYTQKAQDENTRSKETINISFDKRKEIIIEVVNKVTIFNGGDNRNQTDIFRFLFAVLINEIQSAKQDEELIVASFVYDVLRFLDQPLLYPDDSELYNLELVRKYLIYGTGDAKKIEKFCAAYGFHIDQNERDELPQKSL